MDFGQRHAAVIRGGNALQAPARRPPSGPAPRRRHGHATARSPRPRRPWAATTSSRRPISTRPSPWPRKCPCGSAVSRSGRSGRSCDAGFRLYGETIVDMDSPMAGTGPGACGAGACGAGAGPGPGAGPGGRDPVAADPVAADPVAVTRWRSPVAGSPAAATRRRRRVADAHRREWAFVLAATVRVTRDLDLAEECVQDAYARRWTPGPSGMPASAGRLADHGRPAPGAGSAAPRRDRPAPAALLVTDRPWRRRAEAADGWPGERPARSPTTGCGWSSPAATRRWPARRRSRCRCGCSAGCPRPRSRGPSW